MRYRRVEQLVARRAHNPEVGGSSPPPAPRKNRVTTRFFFVLVAPEGQLGDHFREFLIYIIFPARFVGISSYLRNSLQICREDEE